MILAVAFAAACALVPAKPPAAGPAKAPAPPPGMVLVPAGSVTPFFIDAPSKLKDANGNAAATPAREPTPVAPFFLDARPVDVASFAAFVRKHPAWQRSHAKAIFVDDRYLSSWAGDVEPGGAIANDAAVTFVSWFAARAYCAAQGKRLPTTAEWERALDDGGDVRARTDEILAWYATPSTNGQPALPPKPNAFGVLGLVGLVWEWTLDFNDAMIAEDGRGGDADLFCGSGGARASDASDSATFMRYAFRSSLQARYAIKNLGFRCAKDAP